MRLIGTLQHKGYLILNADRAAYLPGPKVRALNKVFEQGHGIVLLARPILREVVLKTGESASLFVREGLERVVLVREEGTHAIRYNITEGQRMELYTGASGKVLLAHAPMEVIEALLSDPALVKRTPYTLTDPAAIRREIKKVRQQGFAESAGERVADAGAVSAPVFDGTGDLVGAVGLAGPLSRFTHEARKLYVQIVVDAAKKLSGQLGWKDLR
jgi:DNA-binding IclR family transcriptional regulator